MLSRRQWQPTPPANNTLLRSLALHAPLAPRLLLQVSGAIAQTMATYTTGHSMLTVLFNGKVSNDQVCMNWKLQPTAAAALPCLLCFSPPFYFTLYGEVSWHAYAMFGPASSTSQATSVLFFENKSCCELMSATLACANLLYDTAFV